MPESSGQHFAQLHGFALVHCAMREAERFAVLRAVDTTRQHRLAHPVRTQKPSYSNCSVAAKIGKPALYPFALRGKEGAGTDSVPEIRLGYTAFCHLNFPQTSKQFLATHRSLQLLLIITKIATTMPRSAPSTAQTPVSEPNDDNLLTITVQNFGPIAKAVVDLRPLTIFVGRSNTGKTYFSKLTYAFHKALSGFPKIPFVTNRVFDMSNEFRGNVISLYSALCDRNEYGKQEIRDLVFQYFKDNQHSKNQQVLHEIKSCFNTANIMEIHRAHSNQQGGFKIGASCQRDKTNIWNICIASKNDDAEIITTFDSKTIDFSDSVYEELVSSIVNHIDSRFPYDNEKYLNWFDSYLEHFVQELAYPDSLSSQDSYFLPANRGGILESYKFIADAWLAQIPNLQLRDLPDLQPLSKVTVDYVRTMLMTESRSRAFARAPTSNGIRPLECVAKFIEDELIRGKLDVSTSTKFGHPVFEYAPSNMKRSMELDLASSMVSELAPIVVIVRSYLNPYDLLIVEEPEAHLHPGALPLVAKCLAMLVRNNVRVLITTHSDWLLKSLRNLILEGDLVQLNSDQSSTDDDYLLRPEVGAWEFSASGDFGGTTVSEIVFDELDGIEPSEIERISDDLYNESVAIRNAKARRQQ